jgi:hypothetical protein
VLYLGAALIPTIFVPELSHRFEKLLIAAATFAADGVGMVALKNFALVSVDP